MTVGSAVTRGRSPLGSCNRMVAALTAQRERRRDRPEARLSGQLVAASRSGGSAR